LAAFLLSTYGQLQIQRNTRGAVQMGLILKDLIRVNIPLFTNDQQLEIEASVKSSIVANRKSKVSYTKAQQLLEAELGLDKLSFARPMGYTAQFSELEASRRFDPEHFHPAFHAFSANLPPHKKLIPLATQLSFCRRGKQPLYLNHGLPVINSKHVQPNKIVLEGNRMAAANSLADLQIRYGDILMNGTGRGTIGRVAPYLRDHQAIPDNHVTILRSPTLDPAFLSLYLNSRAGQLQVEMHQRGTSGQLELYPFDIRKFLVWVAPESIQQEIRKLHDQAAAAAQRSTELLHQAKARVEQLIEEAVVS
jgi:type I restriction enzyme M protein